MKTFFKNLLSEMKKSRVWRFLIGNPVKELPDKFTKMHNEFLEKESNKVIDDIPITINIPKTKKVKNKERHRMFIPTKELVKTYDEPSDNTPEPIQIMDTFIDAVKEQLEVSFDWGKGDFGGKGAEGSYELPEVPTQIQETTQNFS